MSDSEQSELRAVHELETLVHRMADELAAFRRRALVAEARLKELESTEGGAATIETAAQVSRLEAENDQLRAKLETTTSRARQMLDRVRFLRQQAQGGER